MERIRRKTTLVSWMADSERLSVLVNEWECAQREGRESSVEQLCRNSPELAGELRSRIAALRSFYRQFDGEAPSTVPPSNSGTLVDSTQHHTKLLERYELCEEVGRGGMGVVYRGRHRLLDRSVAIKICLLENLADRFRREAQLLASMSSPFIVAVHDFEIVGDGRAILVMDWIEGENLDQIMRRARGPTDENRVLRWMTQVCRGMQHAADCGIVHRDLKPSNILIDQKDQARVADFGLARNPQSCRLTFGGGPMGTPDYMAPEQAKNPGSVDTRADIYSFGATFYHVLTGGAPFEGKTPFAVMSKHESEPLVSPLIRMPNLNTRTSELIERCLVKSPADRFSRFSEVLDQLLRVLTRDPRQSDDDRELSPLFATFASRRDAYLQSRNDGNELDSFVLPAGQVVRILRGTIIEQQVDAIVSMSDDRLSMGGDVSMIAVAGGPELRQRAKELAPVRPGRAVITTGGNLPSRFVIHGVVFGCHDNSGIRSNKWVMPSRDLIAEVVSSCLYEADNHRLLSIAFPLSAKGALSIAPEDVLDTLLRSIARSLYRSTTSVREVRIVIYD